MVIHKIYNLVQNNKPEINKKDKVVRKLENGWIGIGIGSGKFGEEELKRDLNKKERNEKHLQFTSR